MFRLLVIYALASKCAWGFAIHNICDQYADDISIKVITSVQRNTLFFRAKGSDSSLVDRLIRNATSIRENIIDNFSCDGRVYGYYADQANECQIFHICVPMAQLFPDMYCPEDIFHFSFICPESTIFNQEARVCDWSKQAFPCSEAHQLYQRNKLMFVVPEEEFHRNSASATTTTVRPRPTLCCSNKKSTTPSSTISFDTSNRGRSEILPDSNSENVAEPINPKMDTTTSKKPKIFSEDITTQVPEDVTIDVLEPITTSTQAIDQNNSNSVGHIPDEIIPVETPFTTVKSNKNATESLDQIITTETPTDSTLEKVTFPGFFPTITPQESVVDNSHNSNISDIKEAEATTFFSLHTAFQDHKSSSKKSRMSIESQSLYTEPITNTEKQNLYKEPLTEIQSLYTEPFTENQSLYTEPFTEKQNLYTEPFTEQQYTVPPTNLGPLLLHTEPATITEAESIETTGMYLPETTINPSHESDSTSIIIEREDIKTLAEDNKDSTLIPSPKQMHSAQDIDETQESQRDIIHLRFHYPKYQESTFLLPSPRKANPPVLFYSKANGRFYALEEG